MDNILYSIAESWDKEDSTITSTTEILEWISQRNKETIVEVHKKSFSDSTFWFYDRKEGTIHNKDRTFFSIVGFRRKIKSKILLSQPILIQSEIGFLGIICKKFKGVMHFLMQAKIEPGNINKIQISPTIQATKSNFTQKHGGSKPSYLEYFLNAFNHEIVVDQIQSEQSSRFYKKRNRNIIIYLEEEIPVLPTHRWMTLGQIKKLMKLNNLVNMDTRTVLSCIPFSKLNLDPWELLKLESSFRDKELFCSIFLGGKNNNLPQVYQYINNYKMFSEEFTEFVPLHDLDNWKMSDKEISCCYSYPFKVIFCDIFIEGREIKHWTQPLLEAVGIATFGLICCEDDGFLKFLVRAMPEIGCFDTLELGPTIQKEAISLLGFEENEIDCFFEERLKKGTGVMFDALLSEEGGRFYHEQNRNVLLRVDKKELPKLPEGYFLLDYRTLNELVQVNNTLNIQLRNLLSLLEA